MSRRANPTYTWSAGVNGINLLEIYSIANGALASFCRSRCCVQLVTYAPSSFAATVMWWSGSFDVLRLSGPLLVLLVTTCMLQACFKVGVYSPLLPSPFMLVMRLCSLGISVSSFLAHLPKCFFHAAASVKMIVVYFREGR